MKPTPTVTSTLYPSSEEAGRIAQGPKSIVDEVEVSSFRKGGSSSIVDLAFLSPVLLPAEKTTPTAITNHL